MGFWCQNQLASPVSQQDQQADLLFYAADQVNKLRFSSVSREQYENPKVDCFWVCW